MKRTQLHTNASSKTDSDAASRDVTAKHEQTAQLAYDIAERRGFPAGYELDDWLQAEQEVETQLEAVRPY